MRVLNILLLTDGIPPFTTGGMQKHSSLLAKLMTKNGHLVTLMHCVSKGTSIPTKNAVNKSVFATESRFSLNEIIGIHFPEPPKLPGHYIKASKDYSSLLLNHIQPKLHTFDFIYAQGFTSWAFLKHKKSNPSTPYIISNLHGLEMFQFAASFKLKLQHYLLRPLAKKICRASDYTFSFGGQLTEILKSINVHPKSILECSHGITSDWRNSEIQNALSASVNFLFIGRFERRKAIEEITEALNILIINKDLDFNFSFIGDIPEEKKLEDNRIYYHGKVTDQNYLKSILEKSDVLVCPSYSEGMPTVIFEAMAFGLALIATDVGAVNQQVSAKNGWLLPKPNKHLIKQAIKEAIELPKLELNEMKKHSLELIQSKFMWEQVIQTKLKLIKEAIALT